MTIHPVLSVQPVMESKLLHITDTHLFANSNDTLLGINTNASFQAVVNEIKLKEKQFDLIVATGDFVQDGSVEAYECFASTIKQLDTPCVWLAGNHDIYSNMQQVFLQHNLDEYKVVLLGDNWIIVLLDSHVVGQAYGELSPQELTLLDEVLQQYPKRHALIFLHHHPILSGCAWLDTHCLRNSEQLAHIIAQYPNVKGVGFGHIHQQLEQKWHSCQAFSTPSTCVQFEQNCQDFTLACNAPGWREITLSDNGEINSQTYHLQDVLFLPDMSQNGY